MTKTHKIVVVCHSHEPERVAEIKKLLEDASIKVKHLTQTGKKVTGHIAFEPQQARTIDEILIQAPEVHMFEVKEAEECHECT